MREEHALTLGAAFVCGLAVVSSLGPQADAVVTTVVVVLLGLGALACIVGYRVHLRRIRREIEDGRGMSLRRTRRWSRKHHR